jgi:hypothetical protein
MLLSLPRRRSRLVDQAEPLQKTMLNHGAVALLLRDQDCKSSTNSEQVAPLEISS